MDLPFWRWIAGAGWLVGGCTDSKGTTIRGHFIRGIDDPDPDKLYFRNVFWIPYRLPVF
nr:acetylxylan esterase [Paenibacillus bovis]